MLKIFSRTIASFVIRVDVSPFDYVIMKTQYQLTRETDEPLYKKICYKCGNKEYFSCLSCSYWELLSVGALPYKVARRVVVARNEPPPVVAPSPSAPNSSRVSPNHLCVVETLSSVDAWVGVVVIVTSLTHPQSHCRPPGKVTAALG